MTENEVLIKTPEEAIETIKSNMPTSGYQMLRESLDMAIIALKEIQLYKDNKLCLVQEDVYSRQCSELDAYKEIGTVEECREAVEKQAAERINYETNAVFNNGFGYYRIGKCPICNSCYNSNDEIKYCSKCGKKLDWSKENE